MIALHYRIGGRWWVDYDIVEGGVQINNIWRGDQKSDKDILDHWEAIESQDGKRTVIGLLIGPMDAINPVKIDRSKCTEYAVTNPQNIFSYDKND